MTETSWIAEINWLAVGSVLQGIGTLIGAIVVIVAAMVGSSTFNNWRQQKLSERRIEQAERILTATYNVRRGLSYVRSPIMHEFAASEQDLKERGQWDSTSEREQTLLSTAQAYFNRLDASKDDRRSLRECQPMARALFGEELEKAIETLDQQYHVVNVSANANYQHRELWEPEFQGEADLEFRGKIRAALYEGYPYPNKGGNKMDKTIAEQVKLIEDICVPVLRWEDGKRAKTNGPTL